MHFPPPGDDWEHVSAEASGVDPQRLAAAVAFAQAHDSGWPESLYLPGGGYVGTAYVDEKPPYNEVIGPVRPRGAVSGLILRHGRIVAEWGDTRRTDVTFSAAKSYLGILAGLAVDRGLIRSVDDPVRDHALDDGFESPHNRPITWRHLLQQTSEWRGTLWDKPDSVDHNRQVGVRADNSRKGEPRALEPPGTRWEYNDVRVNRLSLSLLQVFRRALPDVLRESVMIPIGASDTWDWRGYRNSQVEIDGRMIESVSGGSHWGGGLFISSRDHARVGYLIHRRGRWGERQVVPERWIAAMATPSGANPLYGYLWWLNTNRGLFPSAPASSIFALGAGQHVIWLDDVNDIVMVVRWIDRAAIDALIKHVLDSLR